MTLRRLRMEIGFDGGPWHGWQAGRTGRGVADQVQKALRVVLPQTGELVSSSRTDSGVHARQLSVHVDVPAATLRVPVPKLAEVINHQLPATIRLLSVREASRDFHARFGARLKEYRYFLWNDPVMHPLWHGRAWHVPQSLEFASMQAVASRLEGRHDFRAFTARRDGELKSPFRSVSRCCVHRRGALLVVRIEADGFLYKMGRTMAGAIVEVGRGKRAISEIGELLTMPVLPSGLCCAPAHGLVLWRVAYPDFSER